eukprot:2201407-Rhodomonas_salina.2
MGFVRCVGMTGAAAVGAEQERWVELGAMGQGDIMLLRLFHSPQDAVLVSITLTRRLIIGPGHNIQHCCVHVGYDHDADASERVARDDSIITVLTDWMMAAAAWRAVPPSAEAPRLQLQAPAPRQHHRRHLPFRGQTSPCPSSLSTHAAST